MAGGAADLRAGDPDQTVVRRALGGREAGVDLVVVGDRERVETDGLGLGEQEVDRITAVEGQIGVTVKLGRQHTRTFGQDSKNHPVPDGSMPATGRRGCIR